MNYRQVKKALDAHNIKYSADDELYVILCYVYAFSDDYDIIYYDGSKMMIESLDCKEMPCTKNNLRLWLGY